MKTATNPATMTPAQINKALDQIDARSSRVTDAMIAAGFGHVRYSDVVAESFRCLKTGEPLHPLFAETLALSDAGAALRNEIRARYGPGAPSRLPLRRGFGRRAPVNSAGCWKAGRGGPQGR